MKVGDETLARYLACSAARLKPRVRKRKGELDPFARCLARLATRLKSQVDGMVGRVEALAGYLLRLTTRLKPRLLKTNLGIETLARYIACSTTRLKPRLQRTKGGVEALAGGLSGNDLLDLWQNVRWLISRPQNGLLLLLLFTATACQPQPAVSSSSPTPQFSSTPAPRLPSTSTPQLLSIPTSQPPATPAPLPSPTTPPVTTLLFTGIIVPARCVQAGIDAYGSADYIFAEVRDLIAGADLAVGTLNATLSDYPPRTGCVDTFLLVGEARNADALQRAGFDAMSVATNHIKNCGLASCGDRAFLDTLDNLRRVGIVPIGAGKNLAEALQPVVFTLNGVRFGIVSLGQIEPMAFAGEETPGIAVLTEESLRESVASTRQIADVVIAMPHWGPEYVAVPNWIQRNLARVAVEAGADLVVGNHTHVVQAIQEIEGIPVFYGLGNFVFDQYWQPDLYQSVILRVTFEGDRYSGYELIPVRSDKEGRVQLAGPEEAAQILERIEQASETIQ